MNREEFEARYELIEQVTRGEIESHHALHHSGVVVMVHIVSAEPSFQAKIERAVLEVGGGPPDGQVLEIHRFDGRTILVTRFLMDFESIEAWIGQDRATGGEPSSVPGPTSSPEGPTAAGDESDPAPGEFTSLFQAASPPAPPPQREPPTGTDEGTPPDAGGGASADETAGEFTRMFRAREDEPEVDATTPEGAGTEPRPPAADSGASPPGPEGEGTAPAGDGAGEFTRMFRAPGSGEKPASDGLGPRDAAAQASTEDPLPAPPEPATREDEPVEEAGAGEFTRMFRPGDVAPPAPPPVAPGTPAPPPPSHPSTEEGPGEFTRFFSASEAPGDRPPAPPDRPLGEADGPGEFTRFFSTPDTASTPSGAGSSPPPTRKTPRVSPPVSEPEAPSWTDALRQPGREPSGPSGPSAQGTGTPAPDEPPPPVEGGFTQMFGAERRPVEPRPAARGGDSPKGQDPAPPEEAPGGSGSKPGLPRRATGGSPNLDSLLRRPRVPRPRAPAVVRAPTPRNVARAAAGAIEAAANAKGGGGSGEGAEPSGASRRGIVIGMAVLAVVALAFALFVALWDFTPAETEGTPPPQDSVSAPPAEPGAQISSQASGAA